MKDWFFENTYYWQRHGIVATTIMFSIVILINFFKIQPNKYMVGMVAGALFYIGREVTDYEMDKSGDGSFDYKGLFGGVLPPLLFYILFTI